MAFYLIESDFARGQVQADDSGIICTAQDFPGFVGQTVDYLAEWLVNNNHPPAVMRFG